MLSSNSECGRFLNGIVSLGEIASCFRECTDKKILKKRAVRRQKTREVTRSLTQTIIKQGGLTISCTEKFMNVDGEVTRT